MCMQFVLVDRLCSVFREFCGKIKLFHSSDLFWAGSHTNFSEEGNSRDKCFCPGLVASPAEMRKNSPPKLLCNYSVMTATGWIPSHKSECPSTSLDAVRTPHPQANHRWVVPHDRRWPVLQHRHGGRCQRVQQRWRPQRGRGAISAAGSKAPKGGKFPQRARQRGGGEAHRGQDCGDLLTRQNWQDFQDDAEHPGARFVFACTYCESWGREEFLPCRHKKYIWSIMLLIACSKYSATKCIQPAPLCEKGGEGEGLRRSDTRAQSSITPTFAPQILSYQLTALSCRGVRRTLTCKSPACVRAGGGQQRRHWLDCSTGILCNAFLKKSFCRIVTGAKNTRSAALPALRAPSKAGRGELWPAILALARPCGRVNSLLCN